MSPFSDVFMCLWFVCHSYQDSEDEDEYYNPKKRPLDEGYAESQF